MPSLCYKEMSHTAASMKYNPINLKVTFVHFKLQLHHMKIKLSLLQNMVKNIIQLI